LTEDIGQVESRPRKNKPDRKADGKEVAERLKAIPDKREASQMRLE
jgi:hypothetical protein